MKGRIITIISPNTLVCLGLKSILSDYFSAETVNIANDYRAYTAIDADSSSDLIFLTPGMYVMHEYFQGIKFKIVVMVDENEKSLANQTSLTFLDVSLSQSEILDNLNAILKSKIKVKRDDHEGLSARETEVLKLVATGLMNKQIADILNISLHTVISHRKNLTRKLGINTVSGLTVYALLNGLIVSDDLENVTL